MIERLLELIMKFRIELIQDSIVYTISDCFMPLTEHFHLKMRKRYEAYWIVVFLCKREANSI